MQYDFVCMNDECIKNQRSFFKFNIESIHILDRHQVKPIHPLTYASLFNTSESNQNLDKQFKGELIYAQLVQIKDQAIRTIINTVKSLFEESNAVGKIQSHVELCQNMDMNTLFAQMSEGNHQLLQQLKQFEKQKQVNNFKIFLINKIMKKQQQAKNRFSYLKNILLLECNKLRINKNQQLRLTSKASQSKEVPSLQQKFSKTVFPSQTIPPNKQVKQKSNIYVKEQYIAPAPSSHPSYLNSHTMMDESDSPVPISDDDESQEEQEQIPSKKSTTTPLIVQSKTKPIKKQMKKKKKINLISEQVQIISQKIVIVRSCTNARKTLLYIHQKCPQLIIIHIFDSKMARQMPVKYILNNFPQIMKVTFNCYYQLEPTVFDQVNDDILKRIKIEFKWEISTFFTEYFAFLHFPYKSLKRRQRNKKIDMQSVARLLPSNNSLWIYDYQSNHNASLLSSIKSNNITVLNYCNPNKFILNVSLPHRFTNIQVLILRHVYVTGENFLKFIQLNKKINTIFISHCYFYSDFPVDQFLIHMKTLPTLNKLSINYHNSISHQSIFALTQLSHLNLDYCQFQNEQSRDDSRFKNFIKISKLKHLGLYSCKIYSPILGYLSIMSITSLIYLNLGRTEIDNHACHYLKKMGSLRYLNLDYTRIEGEAFADACRSISLQNIYDSAFRSISFEKQLAPAAKQLTVTHLKGIARYFPKLTYLNIAFNENINSYSFEDFKKLKILALDKDQYDRTSDTISPQITRYKVTQSHEYNALWNKIQ